jgi:isopentenyl-diphosphate delta-isomerase
MTATTEYVILVDEEDRVIQLAEKLTAHQQGLLHRAFSVFIFRRDPNTHETELLLQQRALNKYHSPLLWTNTCCSHPRPGETVIEAAHRRLTEELGFTATLKNLGWFRYQAHFPNNLCENELDYVLTGYVDHTIRVYHNPKEIHAYRWITLSHLHKELAEQPEQFTSWFAKALMFTGEMSNSMC